MIPSPAQEVDIALDDEPQSQASRPWQRRQPSNEGLRLLASTRKWLSSLPKGVRPLRLPFQFARIANEICCLWSDRDALDTYFWEKECDARGGRAGFPPIIAEELFALRVYAAVGRRYNMAALRQA